MKAIIEYTEPGFRAYFSLPIFDSNPQCLWNVDYIFGDNQQKQWILTLKEHAFEFNPVINIVYYFKPNLSEQNIREINEGYFYCLDHPDIKKLEINLTNEYKV